MATEPTAHSNHWILSLEKHFKPDVWPWLIRTLRHDPIVWDALANQGLARRGLSILPGNPDQWSPAVLGLLSIDLTAPMESLRTLPMRPVSQAVRERALKAEEAWIANKGSVQLALGEAVLIAIAYRDARLGSSWDHIFQTMDFSRPGWNTVISCLYGLIPDPYDMLKALLPANGQVFQPAPVIHALLSNPLPPEEQNSTLHDLFKELPAASCKDSIQILAQFHKALAVELAQELLEDATTQPNEPALTAISQPVSGKLPYIECLHRVQDTLENAEFYEISGQEAQALPMISEAITSTRRIQAGLAAHLAELVSSIGNLESAVEAWQHAAQMEPENPVNMAGLVQALMDNGRSADARTLLNLHLADQSGEIHPLLNLVEAQLAIREGHLQDARSAIEDACNHFETCRELHKEKNIAILAQTLLISGLPVQAEKVARSGIDLNPGNPNYLAIQAQALFNTGKIQDALVSASLATSLEPGNLQYQELLLSCLEAAQEWPSALNVRQHILTQNKKAPTSIEYHAMAGCALHARVPEDAILAAQKALEIDSQDGIAHALYGSALLQLDELDEALSHFSTATELAPHKAEPWLALSDAYRQHGDPERAYETLRSGSLAAPQSARLQLALGKASLESGAPSQALSALRKAASLLQENEAEEELIGAISGLTDLPHEVAFFLGETLRQLGHLDEARQVLGAVYHKTRQGNMVDLRLANAYTKTLLGLNAITDAIEPLQDIIAQEVTDAEPYVDLARCLLQIRGPMRDYAGKAVSYLQKALQLSSPPLETQGLLGEALEANHDPTLALKAYQKALETSLVEEITWKARLHHGVGRAALQTGQAETALISLREAAQLEPLDPAIQQTLANACLELGMYEDSLAYARTTLQLNPGQTQLMAWFAQHARNLYAASDGHINALSEAGKVLSEAIRSDPHQTELYIDLGRIHQENGNQEAALRAFLLAADNNTQGSLSLAQVLLLARQLRHLGEAKKAANLLTQTLTEYTSQSAHELEQDRPETQLWYELSITQIQVGNPVAAIQAIDQAIACQPNNLELVAKKAELLMECNQLKDARSVLDSLLATTPDDLCLHIKAGMVKRCLGEYSSALAHAEHALELLAPDTLKSTVAKAHSLAAQLARSLLMPDKALTIIGSVDPDTTDQATMVEFLNTCIEIGYDFQDEGLIAASIVKLDEFSPVDPRSMANLARKALRDGNLDQANLLLEQSLRWVPGEKLSGGEAVSETTQIQRSQAEAALEMGKWSLAAPLARHLAKDLPEEPLAQLQLARALVMEAEVAPFARQAACIEHAPEATPDRSYDQFSKAIAIVEDHSTRYKITPSGRSQYSLEALARWKGRGESIFKPAAESSMVFDSAFEALPAQPDDIAARIILLGAINEPTAASRAAQNYPRHPLVWSRQAAILAESNPAQALTAIHRAMDNWTNQLIAYKYEYPMLLALQARLAYETGEREQANSAIEMALSHWPNEPRWHALQAEIKLDLALQIQNNHTQREADILTAITHLEKAVELEPEEYTHALKLGQVYLWRGAPIQAIRSLERATQIAPDEMDPWYSLAQAYRATGELDDARDCAEKALEKTTEPITIQILLAEIELDTNDPRSAQKRIQAILDDQPEHPKAMHILALTLEKMNRPSDALATFEKLIPLSKAPFTLELERARVLEKAQGAKASIEALQEIVERYPEEPLALAGLARALLSDGQVQPAIDAAQKALVYNKGQLDQYALADLNQRIGHHALQAGQLDLAVHHLTLAVELDPNSLEAYLDLGATYLERRQHQYALDIFTQAMALSQDDYRPYYQAGLALKEMKDYQAAEEMLNRASQLAPNEIGIHRLLTAVVALNLIHNRRASTISHYTEGL